MRRLRSSRAAALLSMLLLLLQVIVTADHLSAQAFAAALGQPLSGISGFLDVCRSPQPAGTPDGGASLPEPASPCPACLVAASGACGPAGSAVPVAVPMAMAVAHSAPLPGDLADPQPFRHYGATRGPPAP